MTWLRVQARLPEFEFGRDCLFLIKVLHKSLSFGHSMSYEAAIDAGALGAARQMMCLRVPAVLSSQGLAGDETM
jgi:hypothetical protein